MAGCNLLAAVLPALLVAHCSKQALVLPPPRLRKQNLILGPNRRLNIGIRSGISVGVGVSIVGVVRSIAVTVFGL